MFIHEWSFRDDTRASRSLQVFVGTLEFHHAMLAGSKSDLVVIYGRGPIGLR